MSRRDVSILSRCAATFLLIVLVGTIGSRPHVLAQQAPSDFDALIAKAEKAVTDQHWDEASTLFESIRSSARDRGDEFWEARGRFGLGKIARARGQYANAQEHFVTALATFERLKATPFVGVTASALGAMSYSLGNDRESREYYREAAAAFDVAGDPLNRARAVFGSMIGDTSLDPGARERTYDELLNVARTAGDDGFQAGILHKWGDNLFNSADYERASEKLESAAALADKAGDREELATIYTSLGRLYRVHGQPKAAVTYQLKALSLAEASASPRVRVQSLNAVGVAYEALLDFAEARKYYELALAAAEATGSPAIVDFIRAELGGLLVHMGDGERARPLLEDLLARGVDQTHRLVRLDQLSKAYYLVGRFEDSRATAQKALDVCSRGVPVDCVYVHLRLADANLALGREDAALEEEAAALQAIEDVHSKLGATDFLKQEFFHFWEPSYSLGIELHFRRGEFREALETAELARSRGFVDLLASHDIGEGDRVVPSLTALTVRGSTSTIRSEAVADAPSADRVVALAARLHSTIVEYWVARDSVYVWTVAPDGAVHGATVRIPQTKLEQLVRETSPFAAADSGKLAQIRSRGDGKIVMGARRNAAWRELYNLLVKPIERDLPRTAGARLTIVPHGPLLHLPFAALRDAQGRYLIERYTIHSVPAAAVLQFTRQRQSTHEHSGSLLLVADPASPPKVAGEPPLPRLPGAVDEVRAIARLVPASRATVLSGTDATEARVRGAIASRDVIHLATHAIVRDADPMSSFLALSAERGGDGRLTAERIYRMKLDADLIVLSACRSGDGMITGDGIASLARAFFYAGAPSVLVSVWDVADAPTSRLLPAFYRAWLAGADKARALRGAQLELIRELRAGRVMAKTPLGDVVIPEDPAFWAGFVLLGEPN